MLTIVPLAVLVAVVGLVVVPSPAISLIVSRMSEMAIGVPISDDVAEIGFARALMRSMLDVGLG